MTRPASAQRGGIGQENPLPIRVLMALALFAIAAIYPLSIAMPQSASADEQLRSIADADIAPIADVVYTGQAQRPDVTVTYEGRTLTAGTTGSADYSVAYGSYANAGEAKVVIRGREAAGWEGEVEIPYTILPVDIGTSEAMTWDDIDDQYFRGTTVTVDGIGAFVQPSGYEERLRDGRNATYSFTGNTRPGTATVTVTGEGNFTGSKTLTFDIYAFALDATVSGIEQTYYLTGDSIRPVPIVSIGSTVLREGRDYTLSYGANSTTGADTGVVIIGTSDTTTLRDEARYVRFNIAKAPADGVDIVQAKVSVPNQVYDGTPKEPKPTVTLGGATLVEGTHYTLSYRNNTARGVATAVVTAISGSGYYGTNSTGTFRIAPERAITPDMVAAIPAQAFTGRPLEPEVTVLDDGLPLTRGVDFTVTYANNVNVGEATAIVEGTGVFSGTVLVTFPIVRGDMADASIAPIPDQVYTGSAIEPQVTVTFGGATLAAGADFSATYADNVQIGTATVTVTGMGGMTGSKTATFRIVEPGSTGGDGEGGGSGGGGDGGSGGSGGSSGSGEAADDLASYRGRALGAGFTDLDPNGWYLNLEGGAFPGTDVLYLDYAVGKGLMTGYDGTTLFGPDDGLTRAQAAMVLFRMANPGVDNGADENATGLPDVDDGAWYTRAVNWCYAEGVVTGYLDGDGRAFAFGPNDQVTREQLATMIARYFVEHGGMSYVGEDVSGFSDAPDMPDWAWRGIAFCNAHGVMTGFSGTTQFGTGHIATRAEMAKIMAVTNRLLSLL